MTRLEEAGRKALKNATITEENNLFDQHESVLIYRGVAAIPELDRFMTEVYLDPIVGYVINTVKISRANSHVEIGWRIIDEYELAKFLINSNDGRIEDRKY